MFDVGKEKHFFLQKKVYYLLETKNEFGSYYKSKTNKKRKSWNPIDGSLKYKVS